MGLELGTDDATNASLLKQLTKAVAKLLSGSGSGAGELLSIVGVNPSVILGTQMKGSFTVKAGGDYAGGLVGEGSGTVIGDSSQDHLQNLTFWKYNNPRGSLSSAPLPSTVLNQSAPAAPTRAASPAICNRHSTYV